MFSNIKIKTLITAALGLLTVLLLIACGLEIYNINRMEKQLQDISLKDMEATASVEKIRSRMEINHSQILQALQHNPAMDWSKLHDHETAIHFKIISDASNEIDQIWEQYIAGIDSPEEKELADEWFVQSGKLGLDAINAAGSAIQENRWDDAEMIFIREITPTYQAADAALRLLTDFLEKRGQTDGVKVSPNIKWVDYFISGALFACALLAIAVGFLLVRGIVLPPNRTIDIARGAAEDNLSGHIEAESTNEIEQLLQTLKKMNSSLTGIVHNVRSTTETISGVSSQIYGNLDLSSRIEQRASSPEGTASSMEELAEIVQA